MMLLKLIRDSFTPTATEGRLFVDGVFEAYTLEDRAIDWSKESKVKGKTAIPCGRYAIEITRSNRFKRRMIEVLDVPHFEGIRIHAGNTVADTEGCPLVGDKRTSPTDGWIGESRKAESRLFAKVDAALSRDDEVWLTIEEKR